MRKYLLYNKPAFILLVLLKVLWGAGYVGFSLILQWLVNLVMTDGATVGQFFAALGWALGYVAAIMGLAMVKDRFNALYVNRAVQRLKDDIGARLLNEPYGEFAKDDSSKYLSHLTNDVKTVSVSWFNSVMSLPEEFATFAFAVGVAFYINYTVALTMLGLTLLLFIVPLIFNKPLNRANLELSGRLKDYTAILKQTFLGMDVVKNFNAQDRIGADIRLANERLCRKNSWLETLNILAQDVGILVVVLLQLGSIAISGYLLIKGVLLIGAIVAVVQLGGNMYAPIMNIASRAALISGVRQLGNTLVSLSLPVDAPAGDARFQKGIFVRGLRYSYGQEDVLKGIDLDFEKGKKYLIVGKSGSGKSTLIKLIGKMYAGYEGDIRLDDTEYRRISEKSFYTLAATAQQKSYIFDRSVRENIDFTGSGKETALASAVRNAELTAFVNAQEKGLDAPIGEEVNQISGGEKQRIGLARALYKESDILLLDEVTSSLDKETAYAVERNVLGLAGTTVLNVSHKLHADLIPLYDKVLIIENGETVLFAPPAEIGGETLKTYLTA